MRLLSNALLGRHVLPTSDIESCTRSAQSIELQVRPGHYFSMVDMPGIGETAAKDAKYLRWYGQMIEKSDVIVYVLRADSRDYAVDDMVFEQLFADAETRQKIVLVLNHCDKIEPIARENRRTLSERQLANLRRKVRDVQARFSVRNAVIPYCADTGWNLPRLAAQLVQVIAQSSEIAIGTMFCPGKSDIS